MNPLLQNYISKQVAEAISKESSQITSAICSGISEDASTEEVFSAMLINVLKISISSSVCTVLEQLDSLGVISLQDDEDVLRRTLLSVLKD